MRPSESPDTDGIFTLQPLLPLDSVNLDSTAVPHAKRSQSTMKISAALEKYKSWADRQFPGVRLWDIGGYRQYTVLPDGELVMHDVEPLYEPITS